ncbi:protein DETOXIFICATION 44, chloroplastic isoform X2 [Ricinus communis]|uniref:protein DETOXIFICATION 44, chloroplastic isoform X2 n=1 Tax=Ricinus communis TaxID=3988 RepID=UPI000D6981B3|nr:protein DETOXIFICATION 44, chloroplastic isoform X2 [Ricinus communis]|eukprot:XP_025014461.1 protein DETOXIFICATION 44, chloroplastic isoform X2 [Ricinus communis]
MVTTILLSQNLVTVHSFQSNYTFPKSQSLITIPKCSVRLRPTAPKSSHKKTTTSTSLETELKPSVSREQEPTPSTSSLLHSFSRFVSRLRDGFRVDEIGIEILSIALPAALALAADPIASLVDTAFIGHTGAVELAAVGVSVSVFNLVSKLFNVPLLNVTTSFVAEEQALLSKAKANNTSDFENQEQGKAYLPAVSTSLALAAGVGIAEAIALFFGSGFLMNIMGIPVDSPMRIPAENFLTWRAFGAPPIVIALAAQGTFRGFKDTKTPLYAIGAGNLLNAILDPILIFTFGFGIGGAAIATVTSEYLIAFVLLWELNGKVSLISPNIDGRRVVSYLNSGGLLIGRTIAVLLTMTLATSMAAREGPIPMAGHQICMQVWLAVSLLNDALALAGQALLASGFSQGNYEEARQVIYRVLQIGVVTGIALGVILSLGFGAFSSLFSTDSEVLEIAWSGILVLVGLISSAFILAAAPVYGLPGVWTGLFLFMTLRVVAGIWRLGTKTGPWKMLWDRVEQESE